VGIEERRECEWQVITYNALVFVHSMKYMRKRERETLCPTLFLSHL